MSILHTMIIDALSFTLPLFMIAIGGIYSERSGVTMLALEGLQGFGAFVGALAATLLAGSFAASSQAPMFLAMVFAMLGGMVYSLVHAVLCVNFKANQVISGVVTNILAMALTTFLTSQINATVFGAPSNKFVLSTSVRLTVPGLSGIPVLGAIFTKIYPFELVILAVALLAWYFLYQTPFGMHLRACGDNPHAVDAAGVTVGRVRFQAVMVCGALSGLGGISFAYSISAQFSPSIYMGYGYLSIAALIFGNWQILPTLRACLIFGFARSGGFALTQVLGLPAAFSDLFMTLPYLITLFLLLFFSKTNRMPRALGEIYDKSKR